MQGNMNEFAVVGMISIVVLFNWIARQCDPGHSVHVGMMQQKQRDLAAEDVEWANEVAIEMAGELGRAIVFHKCVAWKRKMLLEVLRMQKRWMRNYDLREPDNMYWHNQSCGANRLVRDA